MKYEYSNVGDYVLVKENRYGREKWQTGQIIVELWNWLDLMDRIKRS